MEENMKMLIDLQSCDTEIGNLERRIAEGPLRIRQIEEKLSEMHGEREAAEKELVDLKHGRRELEKDIEAAES